MRQAFIFNEQEVEAFAKGEPLLIEIEGTEYEIRGTPLKKSLNRRSDGQFSASMKDKIFEFLDDNGPTKPGEIAKKLRISKGSIYGIRHRNRGKIKSKGGVWSLK